MGSRVTQSPVLYIIRWHRLFLSSGSAFWQMTCHSGTSEHSTLSSNNSWCTSCTSATISEAHIRIFWMYWQRKVPVIEAERRCVALHQAIGWLPLLCSRMKHKIVPSCSSCSVAITLVNILNSSIYYIVQICPSNSDHTHNCPVLWVFFPHAQVTFCPSTLSLKSCNQACSFP